MEDHRNTCINGDHDEIKHVLVHICEFSMYCVYVCVCLVMMMMMMMVCVCERVCVCVCVLCVHII